MKNTMFLLFFFGACMATQAYGQGLDTLRSTPSAKAEALADRLEREINLTPGQREQVQAILTERSRQWEEQVVKASQADKPKRIEKLNTQALKDLEAIITKEQWQAYQEHRRELKAQKEKFKGKNRKDHKASEEDVELDF